MGVADFAFELEQGYVGLTNNEISNLLTIATVIPISGGAYWHIS